MRNSNQFYDGGSEELDKLFNRVSESPWKTRDRDNQVSDEVQDSEGVEFERGGESLELRNGSFSSGPSEDDTLTIDALENALPDWDFVAVQGTWSVVWTVDANGPFGYSLVATQSSSSASDQFYLEQTIPAAYYRRLVTTVRSSASNANMQLDIVVEFLDEDGDAVGSTRTGAYTATAATTDRLWREPPALAIEARIRIGVTNIAGTADQTRTILFISADDPQMYSVQITGVYSYLSPAASTDYAMSYPNDMIPAGVWKADTEGFVIGIQAKTNDAISAGTIITRVENDTQTTTPGPDATLQNGTLAAVATTSLDGATTPHFAASDELHLELSGDGSLSTTGTADYWGSARLLLYVNDEGDW